MIHLTMKNLLSVWVCLVSVTTKSDRTNGQYFDSAISAVDLFCGAGGLIHGLMKSGIQVEAGIDIDGNASFSYSRNNPPSRFLAWDVAEQELSSIKELFTPNRIRLLAGCAPCQPFSKLTNGNERHRSWDLLNNFARLVGGLEPELVTMENVPELASRGREVFDKFIDTLEAHGYWVDWQIVNSTEYGVPQFRRRLVLLASKLGPIEVPKGHFADPESWRTVRQTIAQLPPLEAGGLDSSDPLHVASQLSEMNLRRIHATPPDGGSRNAWPEELVLDCHRKESGRTYVSIYGRMWWDKPAPTMTTLCTGIGNGRFGHPEQHRAISLREAALLQSFPYGYCFWPDDMKLNRKAVARMIGNAVPPLLAVAIGNSLLEHIEKIQFPKTE